MWTRRNSSSSSNTGEEEPEAEVEDAGPTLQEMLQLHVCAAVLGGDAAAVDDLG